MQLINKYHQESHYIHKVLSYEDPQKIENMNHPIS